ncbi:MAG TPA: GH3 auxin-responsive promoter family protein [Opitutaceae bacterium]|nr:GH3 auxin-responsive promoter family protein [Opitutaceae bacterium]
MPALPKSLFYLGADFLTARAARRLRHPPRPAAVQHRIWRRLVARMAATTYGRKAGLERGMSYAAFRERIPPQTYEQFAPHIERMKRGEADVLWPGQCSYYAVSSGTTAGRTKYLPITAEMLEHFRQTGLDSLLYYTARVGHGGLFRGRHLFLGGSTTLAPLPESAPFVAYGGDLSGLAALNLPSWVEHHLYEPGTQIAQMSDWPAKIDAIVERTWNRNITMVAGIPSWILILAEQMRQRVDSGQTRLVHLQELWPNLECLVHGGVPITPFADELRAALGPGVNFHEVYPASEAFIAAQDADSALGLRLMIDAGIFFEFLPLKDYDEAKLSHLGNKVVPLEEVRAGVDYALLLTTPAGLSRYVIGDVVRFTSLEPPRLIYVGRTHLQLSAFGEHVIEKELTDVLFAVCQRHGWQIVNFHVAPVFASSLTGQKRGRHEWWVELRPGTAETPTGPVMAAELDAGLQRVNEDYEAKRRGGGLEQPVVRLVIPGVFEHWMRQHGKWGGQNKMPRCRSDRKIADELLNLTRFTSETRSPFF